MPSFHSDQSPIPMYMSRNSSPECPPLASSYTNFSQAYLNNNASVQEMHYGYESQPGSPLYHDMPSTPASSQEFEYGQVCLSPTVQNFMPVQELLSYENCTPNQGPFFYSYPHFTVCASPAMVQNDYLGNNLRTQMEGMSIGSNSFAPILPQQVSQHSFQTGYEAHHPIRMSMSPPVTAGFSNQSMSSSYLQQGRTSDAPSPTLLPRPTSHTPCQAERHRELRSSSVLVEPTRSDAKNTQNAPIQRRRRTKNKMIDRPHKCPVSGCKYSAMGFDRRSNFHQHVKRHARREALFFCPYDKEILKKTGRVCSYVKMGFGRLHDLNRHLKSRAHSKGVGYICEECGNKLSREDVLKRHKDSACPKKDAIHQNEHEDMDKAGRL